MDVEPESGFRVGQHQKVIMQNKFLFKTTTLVASLLAAGAVSANATMTLTLDDGAGHTLTLNDSGSGSIVYLGALTGSIWNFNIDAAFTKPSIGGQFDPQLDVSIQSANSTAAGTLTITAVSTGFGPLFADVGEGDLAVGGGGANGTIKATGLVNGSTVASIGPLSSDPWSGNALGNTSGLGSTFSIGEKIVITHLAAGAGKQGDIFFSVTAVPEATTMVAGALLLLPFGASTLRILRKKHMA